MRKDGENPDFAVYEETMYMEIALLLKSGWTVETRGFWYFCRIILTKTDER
jgi:hypothetical protein